jgi:hypothetical protein
MVCLPAEVEALNSEGARIRLPIRGRKDPVELDSRKLPGKLSAAGPGAVDPSDYDLVVLAMQEPQYRSPGVRELLDAVAREKVPCMSIMNMPPLPYLKRIPGLATDALRSCYTDASVWDNFEPGRLTLCSPDPQAIRPPGEKINVLQVTLPTNFKAARFSPLILLPGFSTDWRPRWRSPPRYRMPARRSAPLWPRRTVPAVEPARCSVM